MIYSKLQVTSYKLQDRRQAGVTLLLAILVLSAVLAISFSLSTILLLEVRSSGDLTRSEASLYASTGISEQAAFDLKRQVNCGGGCSFIGNFNNNVALSSIVMSSSTNPTFRDQIKQASGFSSNPKVYDFCPVTAATGSIGGNNGCGFGKVTLTYLPSNLPNGGNADPLVAYLCQYDPTKSVDSTGLTSGAYTSAPCSVMTDSSSGYWITGKYGDPTGGTTAGTSYVNGALIFPNQQYNGYTSPGITSWTIDPTLQQKMIVFNPNLDGTINISISTFGPNGVSPLGLPYAGLTSVTVNTQNGDVGRHIQVLVPVGSGGNGSSGAPLGNTAHFVTTDAAAQGNWHGVYGTEGYNVIGGAVSYPSYVTVTPANNLFYPWADPTIDPRSLYKDAVTTNRLADTWYNASPWTLDFNFNDNNSHQVAIYALDFDSVTRAMTIDVLDGSTMAVIDTRNVTNYNGGKYYVWNLSGHVVMRFTDTAGANSVISGIFFK